jgi:CubicO group peptidase (beta-lactamase class C family)
MRTAPLWPVLRRAAVRGVCGLAAVIAIGCVVGCGAAPATGPAPTPPVLSAPLTGGLAPYFPPVGTGVWETTSPGAVGWDSAALAAAVAFAGERHTTALIILHRGRIVAERYWRGWTPATPQQIASAGKSVAAVLVGGLHARGRLALDTPVTAVVGPGWSRADAARERAVTVRHLLTMASGLDAQLRYERPPGTRFFYNNSAYFKLFDVIQHAAGRSVPEVMREQLAGPIGLEEAQWRPVVEADGTPGFRLWMTARDMARFGLLVAAGGRWGESSVLADTAFLAAMLARQAPDNPAYGYLWWLNGQPSYRLPGPTTAPTFTGPLIPSAPPDLVSALGAGDKKIYVSRALGVVLVRHGPAATGDDAENDSLPLGPSSFDDELWRRLRAAMRY